VLNVFLSYFLPAVIPRIVTLGANVLLLDRFHDVCDVSWI
jgi:hypothetical protein